MKTVVILIGKILLSILELFGRGTSLPGQVVRKLDKNILKKFQLPQTIIAVTGSSGKTSTSYMIYRTLSDNNIKVAHNSKGSNLIDGAISLLLKNSTITGKSKVEAIVLEVDERYTKQVFDVIKPTHIVLSNITRDQPPRHGDYKKVYNVIESAITTKATLIVNGDDPIVTTLASGKKGKKVFYGMKKNYESYDSLESYCLDMVYCPKCNHKLVYNYVQFGNVGDYYCPKCDFKRPKLNYEITNRSEKEITINDKYKITTSYQMLYLHYNVLAAFATVATLGINKNKIVKSLNNLELLNQRYEVFEFDNRKCQIMNGKNENAISYNQAINYIRTQNEKKTIVFGFEYISKRYSYQDISWLYDIDFEFINNVDKFICIGPFANDIASRILVTDIDKKDIIVIKNIEDVSEALLQTKGNIYAILNMGTEQAFMESINSKKNQVVK